MIGSSIQKAYRKKGHWENLPNPTCDARLRRRRWKDDIYNYKYKCGKPATSVHFILDNVDDGPIPICLCSRHLAYMNHVTTGRTRMGWGNIRYYLESMGVLERLALMKQGGGPVRWVSEPTEKKKRSPATSE